MQQVLPLAPGAVVHCTRPLWQRSHRDRGEPGCRGSRTGCGDHHGAPARSGVAPGTPHAADRGLPRPARRRRRPRRRHAPAVAGTPVRLVSPRRPRGGAARGAVRSPARRRAAIAARTLRTDRWWVQPLITVAVLVLFIAYSTLPGVRERALLRRALHLAVLLAVPHRRACAGNTLPEAVDRAVVDLPGALILIFPLGFRLTCYYYRKAYYRSFWLSPPACAVAEPHEQLQRRDALPADLAERPPLLLLRSAWSSTSS